MIQVIKHNLILHAVKLNEEKNCFLNDHCIA